MAMLPLKDTRVCLYTLLGQNIVRMQELTKGKKHNTSIFLWSVETDNLYYRFEQDIYKCIYNLMTRSNSELEDHRMILYKEEEQERRRLEGNPWDILTVSDKQQLEKIYETQKRMQLAILKLDHTHMILTDLSDGDIRKNEEQ